MPRYEVQKVLDKFKELESEINKLAKENDSLDEEVGRLESLVRDIKEEIFARIKLVINKSKEQMDLIQSLIDGGLRSTRLEEIKDHNEKIKSYVEMIEEIIK